MQANCQKNLSSPRGSFWAPLLLTVAMAYFASFLKLPAKDNALSPSLLLLTVPKSEMFWL